MTECPTHPGAESVGTCARCGRFYCAAERLEVDGKLYCGECGVRDDVDWLGNHYRKLEGKRSGLVWFLLVFGVVICAVSSVALIGAEGLKERGMYGGLLVVGAAGLTVMSGKLWSRWVMLASVPLAAAAFIVSSGQVWSAVLAFPAFLLALSTFTDVRTRLFFRVPVDRVALRKHFDREGSNPLAIQASRVALLGIFVPGMSAVSLVMGVAALARVNSKATPPIGNVSAAVGAIVFSLFTSLMWLAALLG